MTIDLQLFRVAAPACPNPREWVDALNKVLPKYEINTFRREAMFLAQCGHESTDFKFMLENMNYTAARLLVVFKKYYTPALAAQHARKPQTIANHVYGGRMGNNAPNDGWTFRGCSPIHLTGKDNHARFGASIGMSAYDARKYMEGSVEGMVEATCWFWKTNNLNSLSDAMDIEGASRRINGGLNGIVDRRNRLNRILRYSPSVDASSQIAVNSSQLYKFGDRGEMVKSIQRALGITADGIFGNGTKAAVKAFQTRNGLTPDGIVGRATRAKLGL